MSSSYSLKINSTTSSLADWLITSAVLNINNQAADEFLFSTSTSIDINSSVDLYKDSVRIFSGSIYKAPEDSNAQNSTYNYQALGSWYELEEIVYQQYWTCLDANTDDPSSYNVLKSHVILGQNDAGNQIDIATQITNILSYAKDANANISIGNIGTSNPMIFDETKDISCAQAIKRILKWVPDAISYFDYTQDTPTLNIVRRSALSDKIIDLNTDCLKSYNISPRHDLCISGVEIKYEKTHSDDGETWNTLEVDRYPTNFNSQCKKALVITVELDGQKSTQETREIVCEELRTDSIVWWKEKIPMLKNATSIKLKKLKRDHPTYGYELISGAMPDWIVSNFAAKEDQIEAIFSYVSQGITYKKKALTHKFIATNTASKTFTRSVVSEYEEPIPANLAQSLYEALNPLMYDVSITIYNAQAKDYVGTKISLLNANAEYASMQSPVMSLSQDLFKDTLSIKAGAPKHLYPSNIAEIFRINRDRSSSINAETRESGKSAVSTKIDINDTYSKENTSFESKVISSICLSDSDDATKIELDSSEIPYGLTMKVTKVLVVKNGEEAYSYMLMTEPKSQDELDELALEEQEMLEESTEEEILAESTLEEDEIAYSYYDELFALYDENAEEGESEESEESQ